MTSFKQIEANRRNARRSTGPNTAEGKLRSRRNAVRHGLTSETVIGALEDAEDYKAFEVFASRQLAEFPARQIEPLRGYTLAPSDPDYFCHRSLTPPQAMGTAKPIASTSPRGMAS